MADAILGKDFKYGLDALKKHFIALGSTGSGKTVLSKVLIEEAALNGIPSIIVDPQGDLASLAMPGTGENVDKQRLKQFRENVRVVVFTPTSSKGIPLCVNPLKLAGRDLENEDVVSIVSQVSSSIAKLIGFDLDNDKGKNAQAVLYLILFDCWKKRINLSTFDELSELVLNMPDSVKQEGAAFVRDAKEMAVLSKKLKFLAIGQKELMFQFGIRLDIGTLLGKGQDKTQISVIYLNTLETMEEKQFFVSMLATELYEWMLANPSKDLQAIFMIDEVSSFIPAGAEKPMAKEILKLVYKQARKYGIGCITGTQNPGDIDYKAFAQFGTWAVGRLVTKQDIAKVKTALQSLDLKGDESVLESLPKLKPGEFFVFCPDLFKDVKEMKVRWLLTEHKTLTDNDVKANTSKELRDFYAPLEVSKEGGHKSSARAKFAGVGHFSVSLTKEGLDKIIGRKKKKLFLFFGPSRESLESATLMLKPVVRAELAKTGMGLFGGKTGNFQVYFDAVTGDAIKLKGNGSIKAYKGFSSILKLTEREISVLKLILDKKNVTNAEISSKLAITENFANQVANDLMKKKIISYSGKAGRAYVWEPLAKVNVPENIKKLLSEDLPVSNEAVEGKIVAQVVSVNDLSKLSKAWFNAALTRHSVVYYPYYELRYAGKKGKRIVKISAVNGREIK
ncbi:MAG TPA: DUF853 family protein [Nanoarchaeota archaeon]|nr:DUF853 family protein [Nanoarchaeota archaeon]